MRLAWAVLPLPCSTLTVVRLMRVLQVAGRRLLGGDSSSEEQPSNEELYLQSYRNCTPQRTLLYASFSRASCSCMLRT